MRALGNCVQPTLILASSSPRRKELLALLGMPFVVRPAEVEEVNHTGESPAAMVVRLSQAKAQAALAHTEGGLIVAADTTVCLGGKALGKPADMAEAVAMLRTLRARPHIVCSGITLIHEPSGWTRTELAETKVWMRDYSDEEIAAYVTSGDPLDKAGAYAIQHPGFDPISRVAGCYANVMGLPLCHLYRLLREIGLAPAETPGAACNRFNQRTCEVASEILSPQTAALI